MFKVLSIDGGGIRGLIPAIILREIERRLSKPSKAAKLHEHFDLIAGTSTGGIIAAGLTAPHPSDPGSPAMDAASLVGLYKDKGAEIFSRQTFKRVREWLTNPKSIVQEKYDADNLVRELKTHLGDASVSEALTPCLISAYDIEERRVAFFRKAADTAAGDFGDAYFWQACRATSAAPTYFEPARVRNLSTLKMHTLIDGGVFTNHPAMNAFVEARRMGNDPEGILIVSVGTGYQNRPFPFDDAKDWGPVNWINPALGAPILSILMQGQADNTDRQLEQLMNVPGKPPRYYRLDAELTIGNDDMDDASDDNLADLEVLALKILRDESAKVNAIVKAIK